MELHFKTIPHHQQRYPTVGDWWWDKKGNLHIRVSQMSDWRFEVLVLIHELLEVFICKHTGVSQSKVDAFDMNFEKRRKPGNNDEPGDAHKAPYRFGHGIASGVERVVGAVLGVCWNNYANEVESL